LVAKVKEKTMAKIFKLGMLVLALVFVLTAVGCKNGTEEDDDDDYNLTWTFENKSSVAVTILCDDLKPSDFTISPGKTKTAKSQKSRIEITYSPASKVNVSTSSGKFTFTDK
jgi:hypothetical protein